MQYAGIGRLADWYAGPLHHGDERQPYAIAQKQALMEEAYDTTRSHGRATLSGSRTARLDPLPGQKRSCSCAAGADASAQNTLRVAGTTIPSDESSSRAACVSSGKTPSARGSSPNVSVTMMSARRSRGCGEYDAAFARFDAGSSVLSICLSLHSRSSARSSAQHRATAAAESDTASASITLARKFGGKCRALAASTARASAAT
eukprot:4310134-Pleurochrysis_carterae.AAC.3